MNQSTAGTGHSAASAPATAWLTDTRGPGTTRPPPGVIGAAYAALPHAAPDASAHASTFLTPFESVIPGPAGLIDVTGIHGSRRRKRFPVTG